jgi:hypothetical protein
MLSVLADGRKFTPSDILKRQNLPKEKLPTGITFKCNEKGWKMEELMVEWLKEVWHRRPGALPKKRGMLVLDAFKGHLTEKVKTVASYLLNTDLYPASPKYKLQGHAVSSYPLPRCSKSTVQRCQLFYTASFDPSSVKSKQSCNPTVALLCCKF